MFTVLGLLPEGVLIKVNRNPLNNYENHFSPVVFNIIRPYIQIYIVL